MKTKLIVEIETPDSFEVLPEPDNTDKMSKTDLKSYRKKYIKDLHRVVVQIAKDYFDKGLFDEYLIDKEEFEEVYIEDFDEMDSYNIKIKTEVKTSD